jgi:hypothetical protein
MMGKTAVIDTATIGFLFSNCAKGRTSSFFLWANENVEFYKVWLFSSTWWTIFLEIRQPSNQIK